MGPPGGPAAVNSFKAQTKSLIRIIVVADSYMQLVGVRILVGALFAPSELLCGCYADKLFARVRAGLCRSRLRAGGQDGNFTTLSAESCLRSAVQPAVN